MSNDQTVSDTTNEISDKELDGVVGGSKAGSWLKKVGGDIKSGLENPKTEEVVAGVAIAGGMILDGAS